VTRARRLAAGGRTTPAIAGVALLVLSPASVAAQETVPRFPFGVPAVVLPVQSSLPTPGGAWPGRAASEEGAVRAMDAELEFALRDRRGAEEWALPSDLRRSVRRNPMLRVNPDRVAYWSQQLEKYPCDVLVVGHTHQVFAEQVGSTLVVNPGSSAFNHSCAILRLPEMSVQFHPLSGREIVRAWNWGDQVIGNAR